MKILKTDEQALRIATCLARHGGLMTLTEIAAAEHLSRPLVSKLLARLRRGGVVTALRGRSGGYELSRPAARISVADVLRVGGKPLLEGARCSADAPLETACPHAGECSLRSVWDEVADRIETVLETTSLDDLRGREAALASKLSQRTPDSAAGDPLGLARTAAGGGLGI